MKKVMLDKTIFKLIGSSLLAVTMLGAFTGCSNDRTVVRAAHPAPYYYPYDYYYYPYSRVYFSISTGYYYYPDGANWIKVRVLPSHYYLDTRDRVTVKMKSNDRPYISHNVHRKRYVPRPQYRVDPKRDRIERNLNRDRHKSYRRR